MKYDLAAAIERLEVPEALQGKIVVFNTPVCYGFTTPWKWNNTIVLFSNGNVALTDFILTHELTHRKQLYSGVKFIGSKSADDIESQAVEESLLKILDLAKKYPSEGYQELFDTQLASIQESRAQPSDSLLSAFIENRYFKNVDLNRIIASARSD